MPKLSINVGREDVRVVLDSVPVTNTVEDLPCCESHVPDIVQSYFEVRVYHVLLFDLVLDGFR